jgi:chlorophyll synthase
MSRSASTVAFADVPAPAVVLELLKPITWFPPMWAFACGAVSTGMEWPGHWVLIAAGLILCGPLLCAASQAINDWFDRDVDAINEPHRPIPSGRMPGRWGLYVAVAWTLLSFVWASFISSWVLGAATVGLVLAWAYSAPPVRLKRNGWWGNLACGVCYEGFAWVTGAAILTGGTAPAARTFCLAALYSVGAHGIMTLNDFKSIDGDRRLGIGSLPVRLGADHAAELAGVIMALPQFVVVALLVAWGRPYHAIAVGLLLGVQLLMLRRFVHAPVARALWYSGAGVPLFVAGMMVSAFALRGLVVP